MERQKQLDYKGGTAKQDDDPMRGASCAKLPYPIQDKYWGASRTRNPWEFRTAVQVCCLCPVKRLCLQEAIQAPTPTFGVLAGQGHTVLQDLHTEYLQGVPVQDLVERVMQRDNAKRTTFLRIRHPKPGQGGEAILNFAQFPVPYPEPQEDDYQFDTGEDYVQEQEPSDDRAATTA